MNRFLPEQLRALQFLSPVPFFKGYTKVQVVFG
jgi:hypothetical protein